MREISSLTPDFLGDFFDEADLFPLIGLGYFIAFFS